MQNAKYLMHNHCKIYKYQPQFCIMHYELCICTYAEMRRL